MIPCTYKKCQEEKLKRIVGKNIIIIIGDFISKLTCTIIALVDIFLIFVNYSYTFN